ncbi:hypothetical protein HBI46_239930 [Parastagonospora nodorum]|nr:hypothetical protein HBI46_239930 [Parastagonospora nodorum]
MDSRFYKSGNRVRDNFQDPVHVMERSCPTSWAPLRTPWARRLDSRSLSPSQPRTVDDDTQRRALIDKKPNRFADLLSNKITSANSDSGQPAYAASRRW